MTFFKKNNKIYLNYVLNNCRKKKSTGFEWNDKNLEIVKNNIMPKLKEALQKGLQVNKNFEYYSKIFLQKKANNPSYIDKSTVWIKAINNFKDKNVEDITTLQIQNYIDELGLGRKSQAEYLFAIRQTLHLAILDNKLKYNPCVGISLKKENKEIRYFELDEIQKILSIKVNDDLTNYLKIAINTGMRPEEILALKWDDITENYIDVNKAKVRNKIVPTKTKNSIRKIPFNLKDELIDNDNIWIFPNIKQAQSFRNQWQRLLVQSKVPHQPIKNLRHTYSTHSLSNGTPVNILSRILGHSKASTTLSFYASSIKDELVQDDRLFSITSPLTSPSPK